MKKVILSFCLSCCLLQSACAPPDSMNPLILKEDAIFDSALLGDWKEIAEKEESDLLQLHFTKAASSDPQSREYTVVFGSDEKETGWLGRLDGELYLDLSSNVGLDQGGIHLFQDIVVSPAFHLKPQVERINDHLLLHLMVAKEKESVENSRGELQIQISPIHHSLHVRLEDRKLRLGYLDDDHLKKLLNEKKVNIASIHEENQPFILTAETSQLQQLVRQLAGDPEAFQWLEFERMEKQSPAGKD